MGRNTLIVAPLSVARQTVREASKIGIDVRYVRNRGQVTPEHNIWITNYEMSPTLTLRFLAPSCWMNRQSSNLSTAQPARCLSRCSQIHRTNSLCTATPAPNDRTEIGNHSEFLGIARMVDMLPCFCPRQQRDG